MANTCWKCFINRSNERGHLSIICLQETWTDNNCDISLYQLPNYKLFHKGKQCSNHGGLFIYVHEEFNVEPANIAFHSTRWEGFCLKITQTRPYVKHYVIANIYRPPYESIDDSTGIDGISNQLLKSAKNVLVKPITTIINQMIVTGIFPDNLKISKVIPSYKAKDKNPFVEL